MAVYLLGVQLGERDLLQGEDCLFLRDVAQLPEVLQFEVVGDLLPPDDH